MTETWEPQIEPRAAKPRSRAFPVGLTVAAAIAFAILVGLGVWQLQRLKWKEGLLAHIAALQSAPARPLEPVLQAFSRGKDVDYTRVSLICPGLATAPFVELYDLREGQVGARLISACPLPDAPYRSILVDRGFVGDDVTARPRVDAANRAPVALTGVLRKPQRGNFATPRNLPGRWYTRDVPAMSRALGAASAAPVLVFAETATNPEFQALVPAPVPIDIPNRHFEYALTWFGLAGALAGVYGASLFQRMRG